VLDVLGVRYFWNINKEYPIFPGSRPCSAAEGGWRKLSLTP
jgi:hypothetical protein